MRVKRLAVVASGLALAVVPLGLPNATAGPGSSPAPSSTGVGFTGVSITVSGPTRLATLAPAGQKMTAASLRVAEGQVEAAFKRGTMLAEPTPTTVEGELALAARAGDYGQTYEATSSGGTVSAKASKDYMSFSECVGKGASTQPAGWYKNHWSWCQSTHYDVTTYLDGYPIGWGGFQGTLIGRGYTGDRKITVSETINEIGLRGSWPTGGPALHTTISCDGSPRAKHCQVSGGKWIQLTPDTSHNINYTMRSSTADTKRGDEKVSTAVFRPRFVVKGPRYTSPAAYGPEQGFRCDSAPYLGKAGACIFDRVRGTFTLSRKDKAVSQAASHIRDALKKKDNLYPADGRSVPSVLSRLTSKKGIDANRRVSVASCKKRWPDKPAGKDCDEYPFASTNQGAAKANKHYSVRYINAKQNRTAGSRLGGWYKSDRILNGDKFKVKIK